MFDQALREEHHPPNRKHVATPRIANSVGWDCVRGTVCPHLKAGVRQWTFTLLPEPKEI